MNEAGHVTPNFVLGRKTSVKDNLCVVHFARPPPSLRPNFLSFVLVLQYKINQISVVINNYLVI